MGFSLKVDDNITIASEALRSVEFSLDMPKDSNAKTSDMGVSLIITGKVLTILDDGSEETVELAQWSMVPAERSDCYRKVVVEVIVAGQVVRQYELPNAFVVDYTENYGDTEGVGTFKLVLRQKKDKLKTIVVNGGYTA